MILIYFLVLSISIIFGTRRRNRVMGQKQIICSSCKRSSYFFKGNALSALRSYEEAILAYDRAIQLSPNVADAYNAKGRALEQLGRTAEAQKAYEDGRLYGYKG